MNNKLKSILKKVASLTIILTAAFFILGCEQVKPTQITGIASKGPIASGTVTVYVLNEDGSRGAELGTATTNADGTYSVSIGEYTGPVTVVVTGGSYSDEATGTTVTLTVNDELVTMIADAQDGMEVAVTALTTMAASKAEAAAAQGSAALSTVIAEANEKVASTFSLGDIDISTTLPSDLTDAGASADTIQQIFYGAIQSALTQVAENHNIQPMDVLDMMEALAADLEDGVMDSLDGNNASVSVTYTSADGTSTVTLNTQEIITELFLAMGDFLLSAENLSNISWSKLTFDLLGIGITVQ